VSRRYESGSGGVIKQGAALQMGGSCRLGSACHLSTRRLELTPGRATQGVLPQTHKTNK
jgi:hypothetical protein